jgi:hydrogenase maturation protease
MNAGRILIAGIGNIFFGDDAFGVEVARRLAERPQPDGVVVVDFGIRGLDLAYALLDPHDAVILVDAIPRGGRPGTLYLLEPELDAAETSETLAPLVEPHALDPWKVLHLARSLGGTMDRILLVGCEPQPLDPEDMRMELSEGVQAAVAEAVGMIESLVAQILAGGSLPRCQQSGQPLEG